MVRTVAPADRTPQVGAGQSIHAIYAVASDLPDRSPEIAQQLVDDAEKMDLLVAREDPGRTLRFDLFGFPLRPAARHHDGAGPQTSTVLRPVEGRFERILRAMFTAGLSSPYVKYLVYYDGPTDRLPNGFQVCGQGGQLTNGSGVSMVYLGACAGVPSAPTAAHEILHALGAVPPGALHAGRGDDAHVCDAVNDIMYPFASGNTLDPLALDVGRDDYYGHSGAGSTCRTRHGSSSSTRRCGSLQLTGKGVVRSDIPGVDCSAACTSDWNGGTKVALPTPAEGQRFVRWSGACTGSGRCTVDLTQAASVDALFAPATFALRVARTGKGTVRGARERSPVVRGAGRPSPPTSRSN